MYDACFSYICNNIFSVQLLKITQMAFQGLQLLIQCILLELHSHTASSYVLNNLKHLVEVGRHFLQKEVFVVLLGDTCGHKVIFVLVRVL